MQNIIIFLSVTQQLNNPCTATTHNVVGTSVEETHFQVPHPQLMFCTPSLVHQTFDQTCESVDATNPEWITNLFIVNLNTPNSVASYLVSLQ